jgi:hypothetical protein
MCFDTAKQCVLIHIHKTIIELKFDNQDGYAGSRIDYFKRLQSDVKIVSVTLAELANLPTIVAWCLLFCLQTFQTLDKFIGKIIAPNRC